jgi:hypothetical protein
MHKRMAALVVALTGAALMIGGCAAVDNPSTAGYAMPGTTSPSPSMGASGAPGETNYDWPTSGVR